MESPFKIAFRPATNEPTLVAAAAEYDQLWASEGSRIVAALEAATDLRFVGHPVDALVQEAPSRSHPLQLRASYDRDTKLGTLIHELAHRLIADQRSPIRRTERANHDLIDLFLFDVWSDLYGAPFARRQVQVESARRPLYAQAWSTALAQDRATRSARLRSQLSENVGGEGT